MAEIEKEEREFEIQYKQWLQQFEDWKEENKSR